MERTMPLSPRAALNRYQTGKRAIDVSLSAAGLLLLSPLFAVIALLVKLSGSGPVFFRQTRVGYLGRPFRCYKFRTMREGSDRLSSVTFPGDGRVTPIGKFLRRTHLDELPQLYNVLKGDMSLVGPRPRPIEDTERARLLIPDLDLRFKAKPGITGLSQIGRNHDHSEEGVRESFTLDLRYISRRSLKTDFGIMAKTVLVMIRRKGV